MCASDKEELSEEEMCWKSLAQPEQWSQRLGGRELGCKRGGGPGGREGLPQPGDWGKRKGNAGPQGLKTRLVP